MSQKTLTETDLRQFTGTEQWYRHPFARKVLYTDGVKHVADCGEAYWLLDEIAFAQGIPVIAAEQFQLWRLKLTSTNSASLDCEDGNMNLVFTKLIPFTDFPLDEITFFFTDNVLMLPSEY
ncbi:hypothetical protein FEM03_08150 [Phragmitibacter flavus]|uniref:DUF6876 domain-containing protein n=1 Tax=Phragmitibacter flavus TaxID=2576071 RepID=A0A5R8KGW0_9BACT|nr:DUF6876 family protein [Phragmitibacter flavus]TLD71487.1 hypothetical protein FEM03_08150 [Phragmitibacter flavus]